MLDEWIMGKLKTRYLRAGDPGAIAEAAGWLARGFPVVFPTDTVYGIGGMPFDAAAVERLYIAKGRPAEKGIPILLADAADVDKVALSVPPLAQGLIDRFWPGPLTLIVRRAPGLPDAISPDDTIAVRVPDHPIARSLIRAVGGAVATTSANLSGAAPARSGAAALSSFFGVAAAVVDDGPSPGGHPSTIVDCTKTRPVITRPGPLTAGDLGLDKDLQT